MKMCPKCRLSKPLDDFHKNRSSRDGLQSVCKPCRIETNKKSRRLNPEKRREVLRQQSRKEVSSKGYRANKRSSPLQIKAHHMVENAVKAGRLVKPTACSACGQTQFSIQAHHADYGKPLDVVWVCAPCHAEIHINEGKAA